MRFKIILFFPALISTICFAQTEVPKKPAKQRSYTLERAGDFNSWDAGVNLGVTYPYTDISASSSRDFAYGIGITKFFSHSFALEARLMHAKLSGQDVNKTDYSFNSTINYDITLNAVYQFGNISFLRRLPNLGFYVSIGIGVIHYTPTVSLDGKRNELPGIYSQFSQPLDTMDYSGTSDMIIPYSIGVKYRVSNNFSLTGEFSYRTTNSDKLDGFFKLLSDQDDFSFFGVGVVYHMGKKSKSMEWSNPLQTVYSDLLDMKNKVDQMGKDTDGDGVADLYDKDPATPAGAKVYGDGTAVDSDGDGVPDYADEEPFSLKNAKVDQFGRSLSSNQKSTPDFTLKPSGADTKVISEQEALALKIIHDDSISSITRNSPPAATQNNLQKPEEKKADSSLVKKNNSSITDYKNLPSVYFPMREDRITNRNMKTLDFIGHIMQNNPNINFSVVGNIDGFGNPDYNKDLALRRAMAVKDYLTSRHHIKAERLTVKAAEDTKATNIDNPMNRRVDIAANE